MYDVRYEPNYNSPFAEELYAQLKRSSTSQTDTLFFCHSQTLFVSFRNEQLHSLDYTDMEKMEKWSCMDMILSKGCVHFTDTAFLQKTKIRPGLEVFYKKKASVLFLEHKCQQIQLVWKKDTMNLLLTNGIPARHPEYLYLDGLPLKYEYFASGLKTIYEARAIHTAHTQTCPYTPPSSNEYDLYDSFEEMYKRINSLLQQRD